MDACAGTASAANTSPPSPAAQAFDPAQHKLLCEELKHLYTGGWVGGWVVGGAM